MKNISLFYWIGLLLIFVLRLDAANSEKLTLHDLGLTSSTASRFVQDTIDIYQAAFIIDAYANSNIQSVQPKAKELYEKIWPFFVRLGEIRKILRENDQISPEIKTAFSQIDASNIQNLGIKIRSKIMNKIKKEKPNLIDIQQELNTQVTLINKYIEKYRSSSMMKTICKNFGSNLCNSFKIN